MQYLVENTDKVFDDELNKFVDCKNFCKVAGYISSELKSPLSKDALSLAKLLKFEEADSFTGVDTFIKHYCTLQNVELYASSSEITYEDSVINIFDYMLQNFNCMKIMNNKLVFKLGTEYIFTIKDEKKLSIFLTKYRIKHKKTKSNFKEILETL